MTSIKSRKQRRGEFKEKIRFCIFANCKLSYAWNEGDTKCLHSSSNFTSNFLFDFCPSADSAGGPITTGQLSWVFIYRSLCCKRRVLQLNVAGKIRNPSSLQNSEAGAVLLLGSLTPTWSHRRRGSVCNRTSWSVCFFSSTSSSSFLLPEIDVPVWTGPWFCLSLQG